MNTIQLIHGNKYRNKLGDVVTVFENYPDSLLPFEDENFLRYQKDGRYVSFPGPASIFDLIELA